MAAGIADRPWTLGDLVQHISDMTPKPGPRGQYKKRARPIAAATA